MPPAHHSVRLATRSLKDLRRIGLGPDGARIRAGLEALAADSEILDIKAVSGHPGWLRLRVGDWRILYIAGNEGRRVARIVHRRDLEQAIGSL
ncbi:MAG: type II toxin-antitoxin system RelE family toxin [Acidimicrobiales bacterium]